MSIFDERRKQREEEQNIFDQRRRESLKPAGEARYASLNERTGSAEADKMWVLARQRANERKAEEAYVSSLSDADRAVYNRVRETGAYSSPYLQPGIEGKEKLTYNDEKWNSLNETQRRQYLEWADNDMKSGKKDDSGNYYLSYARKILTEADTARNANSITEATKNAVNVGMTLLGKEAPFDVDRNATTYDSQKELATMYAYLPDYVQSYLTNGILPHNRANENNPTAKDVDTFLSEHFSAQEIEKLRDYAEKYGNAQLAAKNQQEEQRRMAEDPLYAVAGSQVKRLATDLAVKPVAGVVSLWQGAMGNDDPYATAIQRQAEVGDYIAREVQEGAQEYWKFNIPKFVPLFGGSEVNAATVYNQSYSAAENAARRALSYLGGTMVSKIPGLNISTESASKFLNGAIVTTGVFGDEYRNGIQQGMSTGTAFVRAFGHAITEELFEEISLDKLKYFSEAPAIATKAGLVKGLLKSAFVEGTEELNTEVANQIFDRIFAYDYSDFKAFRDVYEQKVGHSVSEEEAWWAFKEEFGKKVGEAFLGGALSGMLMGTGNMGGAYNRGQDYIAASSTISNEDYQRYLPIVENYTKLFDNAAKDYQEAVNAGENVRKGYVASILNAVNKDIREDIENAANAKDLNTVMENAHIETGGAISEETFNAYNAKLTELNQSTAEYKNYLANRDKATTFSDIVYGNGNNAISRNIVEASKSIAEAQENENLSKSERENTIRELTEKVEQNVKKAEDMVARYAEMGKELDSPEIRQFESVLGLNDMAQFVSAGKMARENNIPATQKTGRLFQVKADSAEAKRVFKENASHIQEASFDEVKKTSAYAIGKVLSSMTGWNIGFYKSDRKEIQNGAFDPSTKTIMVDMNAGKSGDFATGEAFSHETTHYIRLNNETGYQRLKEFVKNEMGEENFDDLTKKHMEQFGLDEDGAQEEVVAEACQRMLQNSEVFKRYAAQDLEGAKTLLQRLIDFIRRLRDAFKGTLNNDATKLIRNMEGLQKEWDAALSEAIGEQNAELSQEAAEGILENDPSVAKEIIGTEVVNKDSVKSSQRLNDELMKKGTKYLNGTDKETGMTISQLRGISPMMWNRAVGQLNGVARRMLTDLAPYLPEDIPGKVEVGNASYGKSMENALVCIRSIVNNDFTDMVSEELGRPLTVEEQLVASQILQIVNQRPECNYCYVATDRRAYRASFNTYYSQFKQVYEKVAANRTAFKNDLVGSDKRMEEVNVMGKDKNLGKGVVAKAYAEFLDGRKNTAEMRKRFTAWVKSAINGNMPISQKDLTSARVRDKARKEGSKRWFIDDAEKYAQSATWAKKMSRTFKINGEKYVLDYVSYNGSILKWSQKVIDDLNSEFGLRMYSFSDYVPAFLLENMQMIMDASLRGLKVLAYTKDCGFAEAFADTGAGINISLFGTLDAKANNDANLAELRNKYKETNSDADRKAYLSALEKYVVKDGIGGKDGMMGANWDRATSLRKSYDNVGTVFVATNDDLVEWALANPDIDVVIPYHLVRTGEEVASFFNYKNYKAAQEDKKKKGWASGNKKSISPVDHGNDYATYKDLLEKNNLEARFQEFENNPNYMKLVNETRMSYKELQPVRPVFNQSVIEQELRRIKDEGQYGLMPGFKTKEDQDAFIANQNLVGQAVDAIGEWNATGKKPGEGTKYSSRDSEGNELSKAQQEYFADSKVRDDNGNLIVMYHGTNTPDFTVFDPQKSDDHTAIFFTDNPVVADGYTRLQTNGRNVDAYNLPKNIKTADQYNAAAKKAGAELRIGKVTPELIEKAKDYLNKELETWKDYEYSLQSVEDAISFLDGVDTSKGNQYLIYRQSAKGFEYPYSAVGMKRKIFTEEEAVEKCLDWGSFANSYSLGNRYQVYLNITNPLILDTSTRMKGKADVAIYGDSDFVTVDVDGDDFSFTVRREGKEREEDEESLDAFFGKIFPKNIADKYAKEVRKDLDEDWFIDRKEYESVDVDYRMPGHWSNLQYDGETNLNTRDVAARAKAKGYDGVIFKNLLDIGGWSGGFNNVPSTVAVAFNSNQVKSVDNQTPTENDDIRYSSRGLAEGLSDEEIERIKEKKRKNMKDRMILRDVGEKLSEKDFYALYSAHKLDLRNRGNISEQIDSIKREGFRGDAGFGHNIVPASINNISRFTLDERREYLKQFGLSDESIEESIKQLRENGKGVWSGDTYFPEVNWTQRAYGGRKGDTVLFVPEHFTENDGAKVKNGFKPFNYEVAAVERDFQPYYELYSKAYDESKKADDLGIRFSSRDSEGNELSADQQKYFADSKVRDENGNLQVVYHGTWEEFTVFEPNEWVQEENGVTQVKGYFSEDKEYAERYGKAAAYYLNIKNPLDATDKWQRTLKDWKKWFASKGIKGIKFDSSIEMDTVKGAKYETGNEYAFYELIDNTGYYWHDDGNVTEKIREAGYDGITWDELGRAWMPFDRNAIKRIDNTKPTKSDDIRYAERGVEEINDEYMKAVDSGNERLIQKYVAEAARLAGYTTPKLFHGTRFFGWTRYKDDFHKTPFIYTSTDSSVSANYAGDNHYAAVRKIAKGFKHSYNIDDVISNAESVYDTKYHVATDEERQKAYEVLVAKAIELADKADELYPQSMYKLSEKLFDENNNLVANSFLMIPDMFFTIRDGDVFGKQSPEWSDDTEEKLESLKSDFENYESYRNGLREWFMEHRNEVTDDQKKYIQFLLSYEVGDALIDLSYGLSRVLHDGTIIAREKSNSQYANPLETGFAIPEDLQDAMEQIHNIGSYELYGKLGDNPLEFDANGAQFWALKVPQMGDDEYHSTDKVCEWAVENGYTSVIMHNIYDYGNKADNYVFFSPEQVKSADPVTYDDQGNVIPLTERFNPENKDIRYSERNAESESEVIVKFLQSSPNAVEALGAKDSIVAYAKEYKELKAMEEEASTLNKRLKNKKSLTDEQRQDIMKRLVRLDRAIVNKTTKLTDMRTSRVLRDVLNYEFNQKEVAKRKARSEGRALANDRNEINKRKDSITKKAKALMKMIESPTEKKHIPSIMVKPIAEMLDSIDFWSVPSVEEGKKPRKPTKKSASLYETFSRFKQAYEEISKDIEEGGDAIQDLFDPDFIEYVNELTKFISDNSVESVNDMSLEQIRNLDQLLTELNHVIKIGNNMMTQSRFKTVDELRDATVQELNGWKGLKEDKSDAKGNFVKQINAGMADAYAWGEYAGSGAKEIVKMLSKAYNRKINLIRQATDFTMKTIEPFRKDIEKWQKTEEEFKLASGQKVKMTISQMIDLYELSKREQALGHVISGEGVGGIKVKSPKGKYTEIKRIANTDLEKIFAYLKKVPHAIEVGDKLQQFLATTVAEWGNLASNLMYGIIKFTDKNYWPIRSTSTGRKDEGANADVSGNVDRNKIKNTGATKAVVKNANNAVEVEDFLNVFSKHVDELSSYSELLPAITDAQRWWNSRTDVYGNKDDRVKDLLARKLGSAMAGNFNDILIGLNGGTKAQDSLNRYISAIRGKVKAAAIAMNPRVVVQQPFAYTRAAAVIEPKYLMEAMRMIPAVKEAQEHSAIAWLKHQGFHSSGIGPSMKKLITGEGTVAEKITEKTMAPAGFADDVTWGALWNAAKLKVEDTQKSLKKGSQEYWKAVEDIFDEVINRTQVVETPLTQSPWMKSNMGSIYMAFMNEPVKTYSMVMTALDKLVKNPKSPEAKKNFARAVVTFTISGFALALSQSLIDAARDDDKEKNYWEKYLEKYLGNSVDNLNPLTYLPLIKDAWSMYQGFSSNDLTSQSANNIINAIREAKALIRGESKYTLWGSAEIFAKALSYSTGIPVSNAMRVFSSMGNLMGIDTFRRKNYTKSELGRNVILELKDGNYAQADKYWQQLVKEVGEDNISDAYNYLSNYLSLHDEDVDEYAVEFLDDATKLERQATNIMRKYDSEYITLDVATDSIRKAAREDQKEAAKAAGEKYKQTISSGNAGGTIYNGSDINRALEQNDVKEAQMLIDAINAGYVESDSNSTAKTLVSNYWKPKYLAAKGAERDRIAKMLYKLRNKGRQMFSASDLQKWVKDAQKKK